MPSCFACGMGESGARGAGRFTNDMKLKTRTNAIDLDEWNKLVVQTYGKPYHLQQQEGCMDRGSRSFKVPDEAYDDEMHDEIPEEVNGEQMGVKFATWLARDPKQPVGPEDDSCRAAQWNIDIFWQRNFYPDFQTVANDLHAKGLIDGGEYTIIIDW